VGSWRPRASRSSSGSARASSPGCPASPGAAGDAAQGQPGPGGVPRRALLLRLAGAPQRRPAHRQDAAGHRPRCDERLRADLRRLRQDPGAGPLRPHARPSSSTAPRTCSRRPRTASSSSRASPVPSMSSSGMPGTSSCSSTPTCSTTRSSRCSTGPNRARAKHLDPAEKPHVTLVVTPVGKARRVREGLTATAASGSMSPPELSVVVELADRRRDPCKLGVALAVCCGPGTCSSSRATSARARRRSPKVWARGWGCGARSPRRPSSSLGCIRRLSAVRTSSTSMPIASAARSSSTTSTSTPTSTRAVVVVEWGHGVVEQLSETGRPCWRSSSPASPTGGCQAPGCRGTGPDGLTPRALVGPAGLAERPGLAWPTSQGD
jgi:hypothetical protein